MDREDLIRLCEDAVVPNNRWASADTYYAQAQLASLWLFLKAGCKFKLDEEENGTVWVVVTFYQPGTKLHITSDYYLPTRKRLNSANGKDWYVEKG